MVRHPFVGPSGTTSAYGEGYGRLPEPDYAAEADALAAEMRAADLLAAEAPRPRSARNRAERRRR